MKRHLICLTIDTDPDNLSGIQTNRKTLEWNGLQAVQALPDELEKRHTELGFSRIPITWFLRVDGQIRNAYGSSLHLYEKYEAFWQRTKTTGDELAWHPHLYTGLNDDRIPEIVKDPQEAVEQLQELWKDLQDSSLSPSAFRNGEGWHYCDTFSAIEQLGILCDSTAIPGRRGAPGNPMDWTGTPNQPYFPHPSDLRQPGPERALLRYP